MPHLQRTRFCSLPLAMTLLAAGPAQAQRHAEPPTAAEAEPIEATPRPPPAEGATPPPPPAEPPHDAGAPPAAVAAAEPAPAQDSGTSTPEGISETGQGTLLLLAPLAARQTEVGCQGPSGMPDATRDPALATLAQRVAKTLFEAARDLGLSPQAPPVGSAVNPDQAQLAQWAATRWVVLPRLIVRTSGLELTVMAVPPGSHVALSRTQQVDEEELELRTMLLLRDVIRAGKPPRPVQARGQQPTASPPPLDHRVNERSAGRAPLALNAAILGGYVGWTLQEASGSSDARLTYPLVALGAGVGLGASMLAADEWDVRIGDAWYLSAGAAWPLTAAVLLADGYHVRPTQDRYVYGLLGAATGVTLATTGLAFGHISEGGAALTHSGGALGTLLGGLAQLGKWGHTDRFPSKGAGYGAGLGALAAGVAATQLQVDPSRVVFVDLSASLGGLIGAAAASPFLLVDDQQQSWRTRAWLGAVGGGVLVGAAVGIWITQDGDSDDRAPATTRLWPFVGPLPTADNGRERPTENWGAGLAGLW